jgi:hypothetical protein
VVFLFTKVCTNLYWITGYLSGGEDHYTHSFCYKLQRRQGLDHEKVSRENSDTVVFYNQEVPNDEDTFCGIDLRTNEHVATNYSRVYSTHLFTEKAINIIERHAQEEDKVRPLHSALQL